ncbi:unnamed protein product [Dibothriocephalus latus]|uniref:BACK domain-containing protein n=1 Tax=Dibothriocephalus latus TaxID=60516 RepID=A0A3P7LJG1_DIBLA|nr:unnamed protein product [Dibothriocephalus latus]
MTISFMYHYAAFHQCLRFIYYDDLQLSDDIDELYDLLYAAKKYLLPQLASASASQLIKHMTPENVLFQLNKCSAIDEEELTRICWRTIDLMVSSVLQFSFSWPTQLATITILAFYQLAYFIFFVVVFIYLYCCLFLPSLISLSSALPVAVKW